MTSLPWKESKVSSNSKRSGPPLKSLLFKLEELEVGVLSSVRSVHGLKTVKSAFCLEKGVGLDLTYTQDSLRLPATADHLFGVE